MAIVEVTDVRKTFRIPSVRRNTVREHALDFFRPRPFEDLVVLDGVTFQIHAGESVGIMGRNGGGKSTLLKTIAGIYQPDTGRVAVRAGVTSVLELGVGWNPELDAVDNILLVGGVLGRSVRDLRSAMDEILGFAELERFANVKLQHFSSGMAARLAFAIAFQSVREVLLLDEIFAVGDAAFKKKCEQRYLELRAAGHTIVLVSHEPPVITRFCSRAIFLDRGRVAFDGRPGEAAEAYESTLRGPNLVQLSAG